MSSPYDRRRFLEDSMFAAAAAVAMGHSAPAWAEEKAPSNSPNEKLRIAVIGANGRGGDHLKSFASRPDTEVTVICDADSKVGEGRCEKTAELQGGRKPKFVQDMRKVFDDPNVDAVSIATPNHWHALAAIWAIQAGKDVYVEKPVSHNVSEGRRIVEAARKYKKICQTGTQSRASKGLHDAVAFMRSGKIGDVTLARGLCYKSRGSIGKVDEGKIPETVDYDLWLGPAPKVASRRRSFHYDWHWFWDYGNGDLGNQGIHQMDIARWGLGVDNLGLSAFSYGGRVGYVDSAETANTQVTVHEYEGKRLVFEVRGLKTDSLKGANVGVIFYGKDGYVVITSYSAGAAFDLDGNKIQEFSGGGDHYGNFVDCVRSRKVEALNADVEQGHLSSALCHLGNISYRLGSQTPATEVKERLGDDSEAVETFNRFAEHLEDNGVKLADTKLQFGQKIAINPATETIVGNDQASALLTREYRAPFEVPAAGQV